MKTYTRLLVILCSLSTTVGVSAQLFGPPRRPAPSTFANLSTPIDGDFRWCPDCAPTSPCTGSGSGAFAYRVGSAWNCNIGSAGTGDVVGPASSTDNAIARFDSTTGKLLQDSVVVINDFGDLALPTSRFLTLGTQSLTGIDGVGVKFTDIDAGDVTLDQSALSADRTYTFPNASGTFTLGGNTFSGTGNVVRATTPTLNGFRLAARTVTSDTELTVTDFAVNVDASGGNVIVSLPAAASSFAAAAGAVYRVKRLDNSINTVTIDCDGSDTLDGAGSMLLVTQYESVDIQAVSTTTWGAY